MKIEGWKYYNHAAVPSSAPHEEVNLRPIDDGSIWKLDGMPLLCRWSSAWDCNYETNWWYVIKDTPFDIAALKSKRRYEINKGSKNFIVRKIQSQEYVDDLFKVTIEAYSGWPEKYRPYVSKEDFEVQLKSWCKSDIFAGFSVESNEIQGYAVLTDYGAYVEFSILRTMPSAEKSAINAAMVAGILEYYKSRFDGAFYINDGSRAIRHETAFQDYLIKYFEFRKAYCHLNVKYKKAVRLFVNILFPFRNYIKPDSKIGSKITAILKMEEICRQQ